VNCAVSLGGTAAGPVMSILTNVAEPDGGCGGGCVFGGMIGGLGAVGGWSHATSIAANPSAANEVRRSRAAGISTSRLDG